MNEHEPTMKFDGDGNVHIHVPMTIQRRLGSRRVLMPGDLPASQRRTPFIEALAVGRQWEGFLENGAFATQKDIAAAVGVTPSYVHRRVDFAFLSPVIARLIALDRLPDGITLTQLEVVAQEHLWERQHELLGIS